MLALINRVGTIFILVFACGNTKLFAESNLDHPDATGFVSVRRDHRKPNSEVRSLYFERYMSSDDRPTVVILHGGPGEALPVSRVLTGTRVGEILASRFQVVYFDQRGSGRSQLPNEGDSDSLSDSLTEYDLEQYVRDIEEVRIATVGRQKKVVVLGASWGCYLGLAYAIAFPDSVSAMVLGSCESTAESTTNGIGHLENVLETARTRYPEFAAALSNLSSQLNQHELIWHPSSAEAKMLVLRDFVGVIYPFAVKARYRELTSLLKSMLDGTERAQELIDQLDPNHPYSVEIGGSVAGRATFCRELVDLKYLNAMIAEADLSRLVSRKLYAEQILKRCLPFGLDDSHIDMRKQLSDLAQPTVLFGGLYDPIVPWEKTKETAALIRNGRFLQIEGGHSPFREGDSAIAEALVEFAK